MPFAPSRRTVLRSAAGAAVLAGRAGAAMASGAFTPDWPSLVAGYRAPDWFRDAKFGIWAHWSAQCVPEFGDWYARSMYLQGNGAYDHHLKHYGHPADTGFMAMNHRWTAAAWEPERLIDLYRKAGARYFVALANHHDNFDAFASRYHGWNSVAIGPKRDIVGTWEKAARARGLRFGVSNHSAHAWHWFQTAYGYDVEGPRRGQRYDAARLTKADGRGTWWEGLDPQHLYGGATMAMPDGIRSIAEADVWHEQTDRQWQEQPPGANPAFVQRWALRCRDLIDSYRPDLVYFDDYELPLGQAGLDMAAHFYNASRGWNDGRLDAVINAKMLAPHKRFGLVEDVERGGRVTIDSVPWQTDTCIGNWHYDRAVYDAGGYKTARTVVHTLCDTVSKNGNLLLSIPLRGDGTHDEKEEAFLAELGAWMRVHGEAIYGTRPWRSFGEGPVNNGTGMFAEDFAAGYGGRDIRFTTRGSTLYAAVLGWPGDGVVRVRALGGGAAVGRGAIEHVALLGGGALPFVRTDAALEVRLPEGARTAIASVLRIEGAGLTAG